MSERPRRSTRNSSFNSPSQTPAPSPASRLSHHQAATPINHTPQQSLIQAGSALLSNTFPGFQPGQYQPNMHSLANSWTLGRSPAPIPPFTPLIPPTASSSALVQTTPQAMYTTYPSRIKAGTTTLMQPVQQTDLFDPLGRPIDPLATPVHESRADYGTPASNAYRSARSARRRAPIRYAEAEEDDEFSDSSDRPPSPDLKRKSPSEDEEQFGKYLGLPPPGNKLVAKRMFRPTAHLFHAEEDMIKQASRNEVLVPIRIELETDTHRIKDTFTWNMNEKLITPYQFAKLLLEDLDIPLEPYVGQIQNMITQQVEDAVGVADIEMEPAAGGLWSSARLEAKEGDLGLSEEERNEYDPEEESIKEARQWDWGLHPTDAEQREWRQKMEKRLRDNKGLGAFEDDLRVILDYEVQILRHNLRDRLEWDLCSPLTPESFAAQLCKDLGLSGEAQGLIATSLREQLINHKRAALELGLLGTGRVLREKEEEMQRCAKEVEQERRRLEDGVASTREASTVPETPQTPQVDEDEEDVETLHLTATATREPSVAPAATQTRSSSRLQQGGSLKTSPAPMPQLSAIQRLHSASYTIREILSRGPRPLEGVWRDINESREFGPLLERLSDADLERIEESNVRASRRNRREAQRGAVGSRRRR